jgi:hypothetical protein
MQHQFEDSLQSAESLVETVGSIVNQQIRTQFVAHGGDQSVSRDAATVAIQQDHNLSELLETLMTTSVSVVEIAVTGQNDLILASSQLGRHAQSMPQLPGFSDFVSGSLWGKLFKLLSDHQGSNYEVARPLSFEADDQPTFTIHVVINSILLRDRIQPQLEGLILVLAFVGLLSTVLAVVVANITLRALNLGPDLGTKPRSPTQ